MVAGVIPGMPELVERLRAARIPRYLLTNMPASVFRSRFEHYPILREFDGAVVSGDEGLVKPSPEIFALLVERFGSIPLRRCSSTTPRPTCGVPRRSALLGHLFTGAASLADVLAGHGL